MNIEDLKIDLRGCNKWISDRFPKQDLITFEDFIGDYQDLISENEQLREQIGDLEKDIEDNYEPISPNRMYGINESDFH